MSKISPVAPGDVSWFGWDFSNWLTNVKVVTGVEDSLDGTTVNVTFDPPGPNAKAVTIKGTKVIALLSGFDAPGHNAVCTVSTAQGQLISRAFFVNCIPNL